MARIFKTSCQLWPTPQCPPSTSRLPASVILNAARYQPSYGPASAPSPELNRLQAKVERIVQSCGFPPEPRKFMPHITLARLGETDPLRVRNFLQRYSLFAPGSVRVEGFTLFSSHLGKGDPHYRPEAGYLFEEPLTHPHP